MLGRRRHAPLGLLGGVSNPFAALIANANLARTNNPHVNAVMASPPTVTAEGVTAPAWATQDWTYTNHAAVWRLSGGTPVVISTIRRIRSSIIAATGGNLSTSNGANASVWRAKSIMPGGAQKIAFKLGRSTVKYRFIVKLSGDVERYVTYAGLTTLNTASNLYDYISLDFGSALAAAAEVTVEGEQNCGFDGAFLENGFSMAAPAAPAFSAIMLGDSYCFGSLATRLNDGPFRIMMDCLGFPEAIMSGSTGTGWNTVEGNYTFGHRIPGDISSTNQPITPDVVILMASINDRTLTQATIEANALTGFQAARAALPNAKFVIIGCAAGSSGPAANVLSTEASVKSAKASFADRNTVFVDVSNDPLGAWIDGTGKTTATNGTGTGTHKADFHVANDGVHLVDPGGINTAIGTDFYGQLAADRVIAAWQRGR